MCVCAISEFRTLCWQDLLTVVNLLIEYLVTKKKRNKKKRVHCTKLIKRCRSHNWFIFLLCAIFPLTPNIMLLISSYCRANNNIWQSFHSVDLMEFASFNSRMQNGFRIYFEHNKTVLFLRMYWDRLFCCYCEHWMRIEFGILIRCTLLRFRCVCVTCWPARVWRTNGSLCSR